MSSEVTQPFLLEPRNYDAITHRTLGGVTDERGTVFSLAHPDGYTPPTFDNETDTSFTSAARAMVETGMIDLLLFTSRSAVPLADAFRAYYDRIDLAQPSMSYIRANYDTRLATMPHYAIDGRAIEKQRKEIDRLGSLLSTHQHPCIVEQYIYTGETMRYGLSLIERSGFPAASIATISGRWYEDAGERMSISHKNLTSSHRAFLRRIGTIAAQN